MTNLLGLGGFARSGKDAVADVLESMGWKRTYFSKSLNEAMKLINPLIDVTGLRYADLVNTVGYEDAKKTPEVRRLLQVLGTEVGRNLFGQNVWSDLIKDEVTKVMNSGDSIVVTGVRYPNELDMIRSLGGKTWWVHRPGYGPVNSHSSDNALSYEDFDYVIMNDGRLEDLPGIVEKVLKFHE